MQKWTKVLVFVLLLSLTVGLFAGCSNSNSENNNNTASEQTNTTENTGKENQADEKSEDNNDSSDEEPYEFKWTFAWGREFPPENDPIKARIEEETNTKFEVVIPPVAEYAEKVQIAIASGDYPDLIQFTPGMDWKTLAEQGAFVPVGEYVKDAPNIQKNVPESHWDILKMDGEIWGVPLLNVRTASQMFARNDWIKELGFGEDWADTLGSEQSKTIDEFYNLLKAMKEKKGATYSGQGIYGLNPLFGAFGVNTASNFYIQDGDQIVRATQHPRMKEALEWINKLYSEGLIDPEFITNKTEQLDNKCLQGTVGIRFDIWNVAYRMYEQLEVQQNDPNAEWVRINPPKGPYGDSYMRENSRVMDGVFMISSKTEKPERLVQFLDYLQDGPGYILSQYGIEGEHYVKENDKIVLTDAGKAEWVSVYGKMRKIWDSDYWYGKYGKYAEDLEDASTENNVLNNIAEGFKPGPISKQYGGDLSRYESEMIIKFITGEESLDNWDEYVKTANETYHASEINQEILDSLKADGRIK